jgi:hypothetical protein
LHEDVGNEKCKAERPPSAGVEDLIIVPSVVIALAISKLLKAMFSIGIYVLDYAFPILLQLIRIPLLTARLIGDGMELLLEGVVRCLPMSSARRDAWRARVRQQWIWFRRNISYQAFGHALHHAFEAGMAWVFRKCRRLTPSGALLVIAVALLWLGPGGRSKRPAFRLAGHIFFEAAKRQTLSTREELRRASGGCQAPKRGLMPARLPRQVRARGPPSSRPRPS